MQISNDVSSLWFVCKLQQLDKRNNDLFVPILDYQYSWISIWTQTVSWYDTYLVKKDDSELHNDKFLISAQIRIKMKLFKFPCIYIKIVIYWSILMILQSNSD